MNEPPLSFSFPGDVAEKASMHLMDAIESLSLPRLYDLVLYIPRPAGKQVTQCVAIGLSSDEAHPIVCAWNLTREQLMDRAIVSLMDGCNA
jgi:hypothetical protein